MTIVEIQNDIGNDIRQNIKNPPPLSTVKENPQCTVKNDNQPILIATGHHNIIPPSVFRLTHKRLHHIKYLIYSFIIAVQCFSCISPSFRKLALNWIFQRNFYIFINIHATLTKMHTNIVKCLNNKLLNPQIIKKKYETRLLHIFLYSICYWSHYFSLWQIFHSKVWVKTWSFHPGNWRTIR